MIDIDINTIDSTDKENNTKTVNTKHKNTKTFINTVVDHDTIKYTQINTKNTRKLHNNDKNIINKDIVEHPHVTIEKPYFVSDLFDPTDDECNTNVNNILSEVVDTTTAIPTSNKQYNKKNIKIKRGSSINRRRKTIDGTMDISTKEKLVKRKKYNKKNSKKRTFSQIDSAIESSSLIPTKIEQDTVVLDETTSNQLHKDTVVISESNGNTNNIVLNESTINKDNIVLDEIPNTIKLNESTTTQLSNKKDKDILDETILSLSPIHTTIQDTYARSKPVLLSPAISRFRKRTGTFVNYDRYTDHSMLLDSSIRPSYLEKNSGDRFLHLLDSHDGLYMVR